MDETVRLLLLPPPGGEKARHRASFRFKEDGSGLIEIDRPDGPQSYMLKSLQELYGKGVGLGSVDPKDAAFTPLMSGIEEEITSFDAATRSLTDSSVLLALNALSMNLEGEQADPLGRRVQAALRLVLSVNDYSRQEVRQALRHVTRSVERHSKAEGRRGYLNFIRGFFGGR